MPAQQGDDRERDTGVDERGMGDDATRGIADEGDEEFEDSEDVDEEDEDEETDEGSF